MYHPAICIDCGGRDGTVVLICDINDPFVCICRFCLHFFDYQTAELTTHIDNCKLIPTKTHICRRKDKSPTAYHNVV